MADDRVCVGVITGSYGVRGDARVKSFCADPTAIADYGPVANEAGTATYSITLTGAVKGGFAVRLSGVTSKEQADGLKGTKLFVARSSLPTLPDDEYYYSDLIGLTVVDTGGETLGKVNAVHDHGAGDLLEIGVPGQGSILLPFTMETIPTIDLTARRVVADPPEGL